jgi:hypothetical protein
MRILYLAAACLLPAQGFVLPSPAYVTKEIAFRKSPQQQQQYIVANDATILSMAEGNKDAPTENVSCRRKT